MAIKAGTHDFVSKNRFSADQLWNAILNSIERGRIQVEIKSEIDELNESATIFSEFLQKSPDGIVILTEAGDLLWANLVGEAMVRRPGLLTKLNNMRDGHIGAPPLRNLEIPNGADNAEMSVSTTRIKHLRQIFDICLLREFKTPQLALS